MGPAGFDTSFDVGRVREGVYTGVPALLFGVSSLRSIVRPVPFCLKPAIGDKRRIISKSDLPVGHMISIPGLFDVDGTDREDNGKVCAALLSL